jgi:hypothetical protein
MPSKKTKKKAAAKSATAKALTAKNAAILEAAYPSTFDALVRQGEMTTYFKKKRKIDTAAAAKAKMATTNLSMHSFFKTDLTSLRLAGEKLEERNAHRHQALQDGQARDARNKVLPQLEYKLVRVREPITTLWAKCIPTKNL